MTTVLGIETTAHTFGIGIVTEDKVLANEKAFFETEEGGMKPFDLAEHHTNNFDGVIKTAIEKAGITLADIDLISYSQGPGIGQALRVGTNVARMLSLKLGIPMIGVNHCIAHLEIAKRMTDAKDPILCYVSGANTQIICYEAGRYRLIGETLDNGLGNFLDQLARYMGFGFPGGPQIEKLANKAVEEGMELLEIPYVVKGMDISLGGIYTHAKQLLDKGISKEQVAFSVCETVFAMVIEVTERAMAHVGKTELVLGGGVGCNARFSEMSDIMCKERGATFYPIERQYYVDNGVMIAHLGLIMHQVGHVTKQKDSGVLPYQRTDDIAVDWRDDN